MQTSNYRIQVSAESIVVESDGPFRSRTSRIFFGGLLILCSVYPLIPWNFAHRRIPTLWEMLADSKPGSADFVFGVFASVFLAIAFLTGIRHLLPFGERLLCDRTMLTCSKIPWISFGNRWVTRSVPIAEIFRASYGIVYESKGVYGILIETWGETWKLFWSIDSPEANRILRGLQGLGVNVHHDPEMRLMIRETLRDRRSQL
jgi:hypothetical protein